MFQTPVRLREFVFNSRLWFTAIAFMLLPGMSMCAIRLAPSTALTTKTIRVPEDYDSIQAAIDAASEGDLVLVRPGTYNENLLIAEKSVILASHFHTTGDRRFIEQTIIDGQGSTTITVDATAGPQSRITGFTVQNGDDGISASATLQIDHNRIIQNGDGLDYEDGGGLCHDNTFENNSDDAIDYDGYAAGTIENNIIRFNGDDGIEIRLHEYSGPDLTIAIRNNVIHGNGEDGIQLIDYPDVSDRVFRIERNRITDNAMVGLGLMDNGETQEDFRAASIPERIHFHNNTVAGNPYAITGGDNLIALNNLFVSATTLALKGLDGGPHGSVAAHNLFWNNGRDSLGSNVIIATSLFGDPQLDDDYQLQPGSPAIDAGTANYVWDGETVLEISEGHYYGAGPDLGAYESLVYLCPGDKARVREIRTLYPSEWGVPHPAGVSYSFGRHHLALIDKRDSVQATLSDSTVVVITPYEELVGRADIAFPVDRAVNITYDDAGDQLLLLNTKKGQLAQIRIRDDGTPDSINVTPVDVSHLGIEEAAGMSVDSVRRRLFIMDSSGQQIVSAGVDNEFQLVSTIDLSHLGASDLHGIALHPGSHHLFVASPTDEILFEVTDSGQLLNRYDLAVLNLVDPGGLAFGPSADLTDESGTMHLFMADSNLKSVARPAGVSIEHTFGAVFELGHDTGWGSNSLRYCHNLPLVIRE